MLHNLYHTKKRNPMRTRVTAYRPELFKVGLSGLDVGCTMLVWVGECEGTEYCGKSTAIYNSEY